MSSVTQPRPPAPATAPATAEAPHDAERVDLPELDDQEEVGTRRGRYGLGLAILIVLGLLGLLAYGMYARDPSRAGLAVNNDFKGVPVTPRPARDFTIKLLDGNGTFTLSDARGQVVMVDFWASWCGPCKQEAPVLARVWERYKGRGVQFVGVDTLGDRPSDARAFIAQYGITYLNGQDPNRIAVEYGVTGVPEKFFIDRSGKLVRRAIGPISEQALVSILEELLQTPPSS